MADPYRIHSSHLLPTHDLWAAWRTFSDTDRFNREARLGFKFSEEVGEDGRLRRYGVVYKFGIPLRWEDEPFQLEAPTRFRSTRRFEGGPIDHLVVTITLELRDEGVHLDYLVEIFPRHPFLLPAIWFESVTSVKPVLRRTIGRAASRLRSDASLPSPTPKTLARLQGVPLADRLAALIDHGDPREVDRIRPLALARAWDLPEAEVIDAFFDAVDQGALELRYDLICPSCHGPKVRLSALDLSEVEPHCESCRIRYDGTLPDSVEVTFRPTPELREIDVPLDCINSPVHTPQILARALLQANEESRLSLSLEPGAYLIRTFDGTARTSLEVREGLRAHEAAAELRDHSLAPALLRVGPGRVDLFLNNRTSSPTFVQIERRYRPVDALPLGRLLEHPRGHQHLAHGDLPEPPEIERFSGAILLIDGADDAGALASVLEQDSDATFDLDRGEAGPLWSFAADGCLITVWRDLPIALDAARRLQPAPSLSILLESGEIAAFPAEGTALPLGPDAERAMSRVRRVGAGRVAVAIELVDDPSLTQVRIREDLPLIHAEGHPFHWLALPPVPSDQAPSQVGPYPLDRELARGGMGVVYAATDPETGQEIAIKMLLPELAAEPSFVQRFYFEGRIAARLDHPHTIRVLDYGAEGTQAWMAMERLYGEELADRLHTSERLPVEEVVRIGLAILGGLGAAHDLGIVHRDIKPENVFLCERPTPDLPKVLDFGIAVMVEDELDPRAPILGTPRYISPEQVERSPLDGRADLYAVGLVLYELLCGDIPFKGDSALQLAMVRLAVDPQPLSERAPHVPAALADVVMKALEVEPHDRWPSAAAMAAALESALR